MPKAVICAYARTPIGKFRGALSRYSATDLGSMVVKNLIEKVGIEPRDEIIDQVYIGQVLQAGSGQAPARQVAINAGLPYSTPCTTINKVCGSSLKAVMIAASDIVAGHANVIIAGGIESMSNSPYFVREKNKGEKIDSKILKSVMMHDGLTDAFDGTSMGMTGEIVAEEFSLSRDMADSYAVRSHALANAAWENGWLENEIIEMDELKKDQGIRSETNIQSLAKLEPVFKKDGQVTAGNASQVSDGASAVLVCSEEIAKKKGWPILAEIIDYTTSGVEPRRVMVAPISAVETLLQRNKLDIMEIDVLEHNEAFAAASVAVQMALKVPEDRFNIHGGAVAIGHPLGATGTRCLMTTINALNRTGGRRGIVTICLGGGNAVAMLIESK
ncbi:MAG: thiolase family protein [Candidatus Thalassarchaeaceae archaeon]|jgi:acetyl-CoA acetyltransferase family protein|tara:strand:- start:847 stop:2007 length:1161 start_codon:yes stop_codon:yes gene_type:complete